MKKIFSTSYSAGAFNVAMLLLRAGSGILITQFGYDKLVHFSKYASTFMNFLGLGQNVSLSLVIFAEFFCAIFLAIGLFSRLVVIPLIITMGVALFKGHNGEIFGDGEHPALYLCCFTAILLCGPGKISVDGMVR